MTEKEALEIVRARCSKSGTCNKCPYMSDNDICEVRLTLTKREPKERKKKSFNYRKN